MATIHPTDGRRKLRVRVEINPIEPKPRQGWKVVVFLGIAALLLWSIYLKAQAV